MIKTLLAQRESEGNPIRVGFIGAGKFGGGLTMQISKMKGMVVGAVADLNLGTARLAHTNCRSTRRCGVGKQYCRRRKDDAARSA